MRQQEVRDAIRQEPFEPFRIQSSNGRSYDIRHPEFVALTRTSLIVIVPSSNGNDTDRVINCDLVHVVEMERLEGT